MRFTLMILLLLLCTFIANCGKGDAKSGGSGPIKIGFIVKQPEEPWFQREWRFAEQAGKEQGFTVIRVPAADGEKVITKIGDLATQGARGFVICTPDVRLGPAIMQKARAENLKVIAVDDQFIGSDGQPMKDVVYLGIAAREIGEKVGEALLAEMKKRHWPMEDTAVCAVTFEEFESAHARTDGAISALKAGGFADTQIFRAPQTKSTQEKAFDAVNGLLTQHPTVKRWLICGMNDSAVLGAVRAMEGRGISADNMIGIGINGTDECIDELKKPKSGFFGSALLSARQHGYQTAEMLVKWIRDGVEPPKDTRTLGVMITRENFRQILEEQGVSIGDDAPTSQTKPAQ